MAGSPPSRILVVDDDPDVQVVVSLALVRLGGFTVEVCGSGREALAAIPRFRPDLILLDVMMPGMDGLSTLAELRTMGEGAQTPVVFVTAKVQPSDMQEYARAGAIGVIPKPFDAVALPDTVRAIWEGREVKRPPSGRPRRRSGPVPPSGRLD